LKTSYFFVCLSTRIICVMVSFSII
jgi:hypothetical protein